MTVLLESMGSSLSICFGGVCRDPALVFDESIFDYIFYPNLSNILFFIMCEF